MHMHIAVYVVYTYVHTQIGRQPIHYACSFGYGSSVVALIEEYNIDPATTDKVFKYMCIATYVHIIYTLCDMHA